MAYITKYGSFWGLIPVTSGNVYWVAPTATYTVEGRTYSASDNNDGLSPERALLTLAQAISNATASVSDVIVMLPGAHSYTAQVDVNKAGLTITGIPAGKGHPNKQRASIVTTAADETLGVTAANVELAYLHFIAVTAQAAVEFSDAADYLYVHNCSFDQFTAVASTSTMGMQSIATSSGCTNLVVEDCYFETFGAQGPYLDLNDCASAVISRCKFRHRGATALADGIVSATGAVDVLIEDSRFISGTSAVMTDSIDWTGNTTDGSLQLINVTWGVGSGMVNASADADVWVDETSHILQIADGATTFQSTSVVNAS